MVCLVTIIVAGLIWLTLKDFPSIRIKIVFTLLGCSFLTIAGIALKTGVMPYESGPVNREDEGTFFYIRVIWAIVAGMMMICFGWTVF